MTSQSIVDTLRIDCGHFNQCGVNLTKKKSLSFCFENIWVVCKFVIFYVSVLAILTMLDMLSSHESISLGLLLVGGATM